MEQPNLHHQNKDDIINYYLGFQDLLISISTQCITADLSDIDNLIESSLKQIGEFVEADRSYIFKYDFANETTSNTHEWCNDGIEPEIDNLQNVPVNFINDWLTAHKNGEAFVVDDVEELPKSDDEFSLRNILEPQGIKSLIAIPKINDNKLIGFVGFDSVRKKHTYSENEKNILFVFANMLVSIQQRKEQENLIKEQKQKKEILLRSLSIQNEKLNEYAQMVSHDLKAPLINIHNLVDWFIMDNEKLFSQETLAPLKEVLFNVEKMDFLIKGILEYALIAKPDESEKEIDINETINDILKILSIPKNIDVKVQKNLPKISGNEWKFQQVFQNLIQNAIKYNNKQKGVIEIGFTDKKNVYEFFVKDNGIGIHRDYFSRIFKAFTKLESSSSSSGIGLSIVKRIVEDYKGKVWVESEENSGTTFYFTIQKN